jgi:hypothetical protein
MTLTSGKVMKEIHTTTSPISIFMRVEVLSCSQPGVDSFYFMKKITSCPVD